MKKEKKRRLAVEYEEVIHLQSRVGLDENGNPLIEVEPQDVVEGYPPEKYLITYNCKSVIKIKEDKQPIYGYRHQVEIYFGNDFLQDGPSVSAVTPIWHPNIDHKYPFHICYNAPDFASPLTSICDLIIRIGEMIQYKRYHAVWIEPFPMDVDAADWVLDFAEPKGIVGKDKPVDSGSLLAKMIDIYPSGGELDEIQPEEIDELLGDLEGPEIQLGIFKSIPPDEESDGDSGIVFGTFKNFEQR